MDYIFIRRKKYRELPTVREHTAEEQLVVKSGFVSLKDRISNFERSKSQSQTPHHQLASASRESPAPAAPRQAPQYATLQELFASKSGNTFGSNYSSGARDLSPVKKPKIPIMRLSKEDWNVKCWEERLDKRRQLAAPAPSRSHRQQPSFKKPEIQVGVFQGRIEDVASKLEKVREGQPQDEQLYRIATNKVRVKGRSHEWTDLLKQELERGAHNPKQLRKEILSSTATTKQRPTMTTTIGFPGAAAAATSTPARSRSSAVQSPLGRPIGRILDDADTSDEDSSSSSSSSYESDLSQLNPDHSESPSANWQMTKVGRYQQKTRSDSGGS